MGKETVDPNHTECCPQSVRLPADATLNSRDMYDLEMFLSGGFAPLTGYLDRREYTGVLNNMRLPNGVLWPIPFVLGVDVAKTTPAEGPVDNSAPLQIVKLRDEFGTVIAVLDVSDIYQPDVERECEKVLGSKDPNHPYHPLIMRNKEKYYIAGKITPVHPIMHFDFIRYRCNTKQVKMMLKDNLKSPKTVVGFQTRNPMHRSHFELTCQALKETGDPNAVLLLTPAVGPTQQGDVEYHIRIRCYEVMLKYYKERNINATLVILPLAMRMAGPREAVWHAIIRRNFGCTHFVVGRDHAGPSAKKCDGSPFYGFYDAHQLLESVQGELGISPIFGKNMVYVEEGALGYVEESKVPAGAKKLNVSGSELREKLQTRAPMPEWFTFPEVVQELHKFYLPPHQRGLCVYFTGLPCAGKSTLSVAMEAAIKEMPEESRSVTILDADIIRTHLSKGLGFSREDRSINVRRIGYVASEITKHGGICLVANIAPYEEDREFNRQLIKGTGGAYVEVYVSTPLDVCEKRDIKELYKKARQGIIKQFTGISDPYEIPCKAEVTVDSSGDVEDKINHVMKYLRTNQWVK
eukprot:GHVU01129381.1.p1 GENE.GHVU01129381.1~~GHVU01129381.1.p1  ORF type:complete len:578 (-),score=94.03 GHVU01129381.1:528-2261(-)